MDFEHGRVAAVTAEPLRTMLTVAAAAGTRLLMVEDPSDFTDAGGTLLIGTQIVGYTAVDQDAGTIQLAADLAAAYDVEEWVYVYDGVTRGPATEKVATVLLEGADDPGDAIVARIPADIAPRITEGPRDGDQEQVLLELDGDEWLIKEFLGLEDGPFSAKDRAEANQGIPNGEWTRVGFGAAGDRGIEWSSDTDTWTVVDPGVYLLLASAYFAANATGIREARWTVEGNRVKNSRQTRPHATEAEILECNTAELLNAGDVLQLQVRQTSGGNLALLGDTACTRARIVRL